MRTLQNGGDTFIKRNLMIFTLHHILLVLSRQGRCDE
jgi:hypothetical protein